MPTLYEKSIKIDCNLFKTWSPTFYYHSIKETAPTKFRDICMILDESVDN